MIYHVTDLTPAQGPGDKNIKDFLVNANRDGMYAAFNEGLRDEAGIKINQQALSQLLNLGPTAQ